MTLDEFAAQCHKWQMVPRQTDEGIISVEARFQVVSEIELARIEGAQGHPARLVADMIVRATLAALGEKFGEEMMRALTREYVGKVKATAIIEAQNVPPVPASLGGPDTAVTADSSAGMRRGVSRD